MFSPSIWIAEIDRLRNGTSDGISEIPIPIEAFERTDPVFVTTGRLVFDEKENALWISVMTYGYKGQIFKYNLDTESFDIFDLPRELNSPWGMTVDDNGMRGLQMQVLASFTNLAQKKITMGIIMATKMSRILK